VFKKRKVKLFLMPNMVGLVSIMWALLYMFMAGTKTPDLPNGPSVDMAKVLHPKLMPRADREDAMVVAVTRNGTIYFRGDLTLPNQLPARIRKGLMDGADRVVFIKADSRTKYSNVKEVVDAVRATGVENIAFLVDKRQPTSLPHTPSS
jgi:biopolymer transport protein TolR